MVGLLTRLLTSFIEILLLFVFFVLFSFNCLLSSLSLCFHGFFLTLYACFLSSFFLLALIHYLLDCLPACLFLSCSFTCLRLCWFAFLLASLLPSFLFILVWHSFFPSLFICLPVGLLPFFLSFLPSSLFCSMHARQWRRECSNDSSLPHWQLLPHPITNYNCYFNTTVSTTCTTIALTISTTITIITLLL